MVKDSFKTGLGFGITSGVITTLGLLIGLYSGTHSSLAVIGGILTIAIADAFSDALGVHVSKEFENKCPMKEVWESTIVTFFSKFIIAMTFVAPFLFFVLNIAVLASLIWGFILLTIFSIYVAKERKVTHWKVVFEHLFIGSTVILISNFVGTFIRSKLLN